MGCREGRGFGASLSKIFMRTNGLEDVAYSVSALFVTDCNVGKDGNFPAMMKDDER